MNLRDWYGLSVKIPDAFDRYAAAFATSSIHIAQTAMGNKRVDYDIKFHGGDDFYVDHKRRAIWLSSRILAPDPKERTNPDATVEEAISALLGITVHEAVHVQVSLRDNDEIYSRSDISSAQYSKQLLNFLNLMEDYYVDEYAVNQYHWSRWMMYSAFDYFFTEQLLKSQQTPTVFDGKIRTAFDAMLFLRIMTISKHPSLFSLIKDLHPAVYPFLDKARAITEIHDPYDRAKFCGMMYHEIFELDEEEQEKLDQEKSIDAIISIAIDLDPDKRNAKLKESYDKFEKVLNDLMREAKYAHVDAIDKLDHYVYHIVPDEHHTLATISPTFLGLEKLSRALSSKAKPKGIRTKKGNRLTDPSRIVTDGRIFRDPLEKAAKLPFEIIILVDCSGSMIYEYRIKKAFEAACGAAYGLQSGRHSVTILGHTADVNVGLSRTVDSSFFEKRSVSLYVIKRHYESIRTAQSRSMQIVNHGAKSQNRDGEAILAAAKYFSLQKHKRAMIVISDGEPCASSYSGPSAIEHTKKCVQKLRASDVTVLSISIDKAAVDSNNEIYGEASNTYDGDPAVIERILSMLLQNGA